MSVISIITVSYNSAETIKDTLESVRRQTYPEVEHIVVDGASTDATSQIVRSFSHVACFVSEPDNGAYHAMNKGIALAKGDIIGILNADDRYASPYVLEKVVCLLRKTGSDALYGDLQYVDRHRPQRVVRYWRAQPFRPEHFRWGWMPPHPTFFTYRRFYEALGGYREHLSISADYELMLRFLYRHRLSACYLPEVLVHMRTGGMSNASLRQRWRANRQDRQAWALNGLRPGPFTLWLKPLRKIPQYLPWLWPERDGSVSGKVF